MLKKKNVFLQLRVNTIILSIYLVYILSKYPLRAVFEWKPQRKRPKGRPKKRWIDGVAEDLSAMGINNWHKNNTKQRKVVRYCSDG